MRAILNRGLRLLKRALFPRDPDGAGRTPAEEERTPAEEERTLAETERPSPDEARTSAETGRSSPEVAPSPPGPGQIGAVLWRLLRGLSPCEDMSDRERQRLSGFLFLGAHRFVDQIVNALRDAPDLSPDPALSWSSLQQRHRRAMGWRALHGVLRRLTELAGDTYIKEQAEVVQESMRVVQALRHDFGMQEQRGLPPDEEMRRRYLALSPALGLLRRYNQRKRRTERRNQRAVLEGKAPPAPRGRARRPDTTLQARTQAAFSAWHRPSHE